MAAQHRCSQRPFTCKLPGRCELSVARPLDICRELREVVNFMLLPVQDKIQMHLDRMYLLLQRLRRNKNFSRPAFAGLKASSRGFIEVLPIAFLAASTA